MVAYSIKVHVMVLKPGYNLKIQPNLHKTRMVKLFLEAKILKRLL